MDDVKATWEVVFAQESADSLPISAFNRKLAEALAAACEAFARAEGLEVEEGRLTVSRSPKRMRLGR